MTTPCNWLAAAESAIDHAEHLSPGCARAISLRLSKLLLQRLGDPLATQILGLLPADERALFSGHGVDGTLLPDRSLGLPAFISHAGFVLGVEQPEMPHATHELSLRKIVACFLDGTLEAIPLEIRPMLRAALPQELLEVPLQVAA